MKTSKLLFSFLLIYFLNNCWTQNASDLDNTFSHNGIKILNFGPGNYFGSKVGIQSSNKIIFIGEYSDSQMIIRINLNGDIDKEFGGNGSGYVKTDGIYLASLQNDDKIVLVGKNATGNLVLSRLTSNGLLDNSFGINGIQISNNIGSYSIVKLIEVYSDGKILVLAKIYNNVWKLGLYRFKSNGLLDNSFSEDGIVLIPNDKVDYLNSLKIQTDGKILIGISNKVFRFNGDGTFDYLFGINGEQEIPISEIYSLETLSDDKIICIGDKNFGGKNVFALSRLDKNGSIDEYFIKEGLQICSFGRGAYARDIKLLKEGKIIVGGFTYANGDENEGDVDFALAMFNNDGTLDKSFGQNGIQTTDFQFSDDFAYSIAIQKDGKILLAGDTDNGFALARYLGTYSTSIINQTASAKDGDLNIFPNPAFDNVFIEGIQHSGKVEILNMHGQIMGTKDVVEETTSIDLSKLGSGVFILRINTNGEVIDKKLVKL